MSFSENLKVLREEKNLSQEQLAELLDVSRQAVSKWENDSGYPETEKLIQIAQKLDVSLDSLLLDQQLIDDVVDNSKNDSIIFPVNKTISIKSKEGKYISAFYKFRIRKIVLPKKEGPNCMICGTNSSVFLGEIIQLRWAGMPQTRMHIRNLARYIKLCKMERICISLYIPQIQNRDGLQLLFNENDFSLILRINYNLSNYLIDVIFILRYT